ncbi:MAG: hypothetical protein GY820_32565, partial [Gammaproteobacteria bacterium]|nr:hypothetical protein [Gammaproteobacteria bacterium]
RAMYICERIDVHYPPFRYFGQSEDAHLDDEIVWRGMFEILRRVMQQAFCIKTAGGYQSKSDWEDQPKCGSIPLLPAYGLVMPPIEAGMTKAQAKEKWLAELKLTRPEWYEGDKSEDANVEWSKRFGAKLVHEEEYALLKRKGPDAGETPQSHAEKMRRCFVITEKAQRDELDKEFYRSDKVWESTVTPSAESFVEPSKLPDETSKMHLTNICMLRYYLEKAMMRLPGMQVRNKRGHFVVPEEELDYWEQFLREYYVPPAVPLTSTEDISLWESQWWLTVVDKVVNTGVTTSGRLYESFLNSQRLIGRVPACAALLLHECDDSGGRRYMLSDVEMIKIQTVRKAIGQQTKQPLESPSGTLRRRQSPKTKKLKKKLGFSDKVDVKIITPIQSSAESQMDHSGASGGTSEGVQGQTTGQGTSSKSASSVGLTSSTVESSEPIEIDDDDLLKDDDGKQGDQRKLNEQEEAKLLSGEEDDLSQQAAVENPSEREGSGMNQDEEEDRGSVSGYEGEDETDNEREERLTCQRLDQLDQERDMEEEEERAEKEKEEQQ